MSLEYSGFWKKSRAVTFSFSLILQRKQEISVVRKLVDLSFLYFSFTFKLKNTYPTIRRKNIFLELLTGFKLVLVFSIKFVFMRFCVVPKVRRKSSGCLNGSVEWF